MATPIGSKSLVQGVQFLEALHSQLLNVSSPESQKIGQFGVMVPRWAASEELSEAEAKTLMVDVIRRRAIQSSPVLYAIKVLRELLKEHELSTSIPVSELDAPPTRIWCGQGHYSDTLPLGSDCPDCKKIMDRRNGL